MSKIAWKLENGTNFMVLGKQFVSGTEYVNIYKKYRTEPHETHFKHRTIVQKQTSDLQPWNKQTYGLD